MSIIFDKCTDLEYLDLKNTSLTVFDIMDFSKVSRLRVFKMPNRIKRLQVSVRGENNIFGDLFNGCLNLEEVELPSDLEYLKCNLFVNCPKIKSVTIPAKVKELVSIIKNCRSLTTVDLSHCSKIENNSMGWRAFSWGVRNCPNIVTVKYQSGKQTKFYENGEPAGTCFYFSPNRCTVAYYENCTLFFKGEANNDKENPTRNCIIYCPKSMMTHFYVEFDGFNNEIIGLTEAEMEKVQRTEQKRREQARQERIKSENERLERERSFEMDKPKYGDDKVYDNVEELINELQYGDVYSVVEEMPEYPGGMNELAKYLSENIKYPEEAKEIGIGGRVFISFIVEKDGSVNDVAVMRSVDPLVDNEAVRVVKTMPKWKPGKQNGKIVRVSYILPINFQLKN